MSFIREMPGSFWEALRVSREILGGSERLVKTGAIAAEAEILLIAAHRKVSGKALSRVELYSRIQEEIPKPSALELLEYSRFRAQGKSLQYITGFQTFLDHEYAVGPGVLVPRPESEVLVRSAVAEFAKMNKVPSLGLEIGVGSGALSIELLSHYPQLRILATELTPDARACAERNAREILGIGTENASRLKILSAQNSLEVWEPFERLGDSDSDYRRADFLMMNPPYLTEKDQIDSEVVENEPSEALYAPSEDPLYFYRKVAERAKDFLKPESFVFAEVPHERAFEICRLFVDFGMESRLIPDLTQRERILIAAVGERNG